MLLALPFLLAADRPPAAAPPTGAANPEWWLRRAFVELTHYQDQPGRRTRQSQVELLEMLRDLQEAAGDRTGRIETCRFMVALMHMRREPLDLEAAILKASPAGAAARYGAVVALRPPGPKRDETRAWAADMLADQGELSDAVRLAVRIDHPTERNAVLSKLILELLSAGRAQEAVAAADHLAVVEPGPTEWADLLATYSRLAPAQASLGRVQAAERSLLVLSEGVTIAGIPTGVRLSAQAARGHTMVLLGTEHEGREILRNLVTAAHGQFRDDSQSQPVRTICEALAGAGDRDMVRRFVGAFPERSQPGLWITIAEVLIDASKFEEAERTLTSLPPDKCESDYVRQVRRLLDRGELARAVRLAARIPNRACGVDSYETVCLYEQILSHTQLETSVAAEIAERVATDLPLNDDGATVKRLAVAARAAKRAGDAAGVREFLARATAVLSERPGRRSVIDDIVRLHVALGHLDEAAPLALAEAPAEVLGVVKGYAAAGRREQAVRVARELLLKCDQANREGIAPPVDNLELALAAGYAGDPALLDVALRRASTEVLSANVRMWSGNTGPWRSLTKAHAVAGRLRELAGVVDQVRRSSSRVLVNMAVAEELMGRRNGPDQ
jgi:hypothetical protein